MARRSLVVTVDNGIVRLPNSGSGGTRSAIALIQQAVIVPIGTTIVPIDELFPPFGAGGAPNPQGSAIVQASGGIRIKRAGWYTISSVAGIDGPGDVKFELVFTPGFAFSLPDDGFLTFPFSIPANTLVQIRAINSEPTPISVTAALGVVESG